MFHIVLALLAIQVPVDTVTLDVEQALARGLEASPVRLTSQYRVDAATDMAAQAGAWPNPSLAVSAENVGQQEAFTGLDGFEGLEGQAILRAGLPLGSERSGIMRMARADRSEAEASMVATEFATRSALLSSFGRCLRDQAFVESAREELETISRLADALAAQARAGRASTGDAARAGLARGMAATRLARREADFARGSSELSRLLDFEARTGVRLEAPSCTVPGPSNGAGARMASGADLVTSYTPPDVRIAEARVESARGSIEYVEGVGRPDFRPELGVRRSGGNTGLYLGLSTGLPLFDRGSRRVDAARSAESVALVQRDDAERRWAASVAGAEGALDALERAGMRFDAAWFEHVEQAVTAAEARFRLGGGTLAELLFVRSTHQGESLGMIDPFDGKVYVQIRPIEVTRARSFDATRCPDGRIPEPRKRLEREVALRAIPRRGCEREPSEGGWDSYGSRALRTTSRGPLLG